MMSQFKSVINKKTENTSLTHYPFFAFFPPSVSLCYSKLSCKEGHSGPTYESMQAVFDLQSFRPAVNLSNPTITNISFTLYAVLGVVSQPIHNVFILKNTRST